MREALRPQFGGYSEGSSAVAPASGAAAGGDQFHLRSEVEVRA
jgi:hypothetical protein